MAHRPCPAPRRSRATVGRRRHALEPTPHTHRYNFYHSDGGGRDGFIRHVSEHQTTFNYVPKAPEFVGNRQPGMASSIPGMTGRDKPGDKYSNKPGLGSIPTQVAGYTGHREPQAPDAATRSDAFPNLKGAAPPPSSLQLSFQAAHTQQKTRVNKPAYRVPGYAGHCSGHECAALPL